MCLRVFPSKLIFDFEVINIIPSKFHSGHAILVAGATPDVDPLCNLSCYTVHIRTSHSGGIDCSPSFMFSS
jgi:hypothetical protein